MASISFALKYITSSFPLYLNLNIPYPFLSVVNFNSLTPFIVFKVSIFFAIVFNPVVSFIFPSFPYIYILNATPLYCASKYTPPVVSVFTSSGVYFVLNASFTASITCSIALKCFSSFSNVISLPSKYTTFALPLYLNLNIPYPWLSVVYSNPLTLLFAVKFFMLFAIACKLVVSFTFPSLPNIYWLNFTPLYSTSIYAPPVLSIFISFVVYSFLNTWFNASITLSAAS